MLRGKGVCVQVDACEITSSGGPNDTMTHMLPYLTNFPSQGRIADEGLYEDTELVLKCLQLGQGLVLLGTGTSRWSMCLGTDRYPIWITLHHSIPYSLILHHSAVNQSAWNNNTRSVMPALFNVSLWNIGSFQWCHHLAIRVSTEQWLRVWAQEFRFKLCHLLQDLEQVTYPRFSHLQNWDWNNPKCMGLSCVLSTLEHVKSSGYCLEQGMHLRNFSCCQFAKQLGALPWEGTSKPTT